MATRYLTLTVSPQQAGRSADSLLRNVLRLSGTAVKRAKNLPGGLTLDSLPCTARTAVRAGQVLSVLVGDLPEERGLILPEGGPLDIVYEDGDLLVINKPAGLAVHPGPGHPGGTVGNFVADHLIRRGEGGVFRCVNRLDRSTSGLMAAAKHAHAHQRLKEQLHTPEFVRTYLAVCQGAPVPAQGVIDAPIGRADGATIRREVRPDGQAARTHYRTLKEKDGNALVQLKLDTGRTHQIRVHMAHIGHPLLGDFLYGTEAPQVIARTALHAARLRFLHPIKGDLLDFSAPLPADMARLLE